MAINTIVYVATDGKLDDLARKSISLASYLYAKEDPDIVIVSLDSQVPEEDSIFSSVRPLTRLRRFSISKKDLISKFPNVMTKKFLTTEGKMMSHWDHAESKNQHLAEFSDLAIFYFMIANPDQDFLYVDSDMIPIKPLFCEQSFVAAYDEGENKSLYINSSFLFVPKGFKDVKERWVASLENEILDKYHFRYGMPGPVAFDKFLNRPESLRGFKLDVLGKDLINPIHYAEMYSSACLSLDKNRPILLDIAHDGPFLNIPRSAITTALTHKSADEIEVLAGVTDSKGGNAFLISVMFYPKRVEGIEYYEKLKK